MQLMSRESSKLIALCSLTLVGALISLSSIGLAEETLDEVLRDLRAVGAAKTDSDGQAVSLYLGNKASDDLLEKLRPLRKLKLLNLESKAISQRGIDAIADLESLESLTLYQMNSQEPPTLRNDSRPKVSLAPVARLTKLTELSAAECGLTSHDMVDLGRLTQLKSLRIEGNEISDLGVAALKGLTNLESLNIAQSSWVNSRMQIGDGAMMFVAGFTKLRELNLSRLPVTDEGFAKLSALGELRNLNIVGTQVTGRGLKTLVSFPHLESFMASDATIDDESMQYVGQCGELTYLMLGGVGDEGFRHVAKLRKLKRITIEGQRVTDAALANLTSLGELTHIELRAPKITDDGLKSISQIKSLRRLDVWANGTAVFGRAQGGRFTAAGYGHLAKMPNLEELWVNNFNGTWTDLRELANLKVLHLMMPSISEDDVRQLQKALPNVQVSSATGAGGVAPLQRPVPRRAPQSPEGVIFYR
jgi:Leucine-rich repeat (LRR) protein